MTEVDFVKRRRQIEDALAETLNRLGDITRDQDGNRILQITVWRCEGTDEYAQYDLWILASELEAKLP